VDYEKLCEQLPCILSNEECAAEHLDLYNENLKMEFKK
jgi:hypothetical protein